MKNLFVLHTQNNIILSCGLVCERFNNKNNDLILFCDFHIEDDLKTILINKFDCVLFLSGAYPQSNEKYINKIKRYPIIIWRIRKFVKKSYDQAFIVDDMCIPEMYIMKIAHGKNRQIDFAWLEDGANAYYKQDVKPGGFSSNRFTLFIRKMIFKYIFALGSFYDMGGFMGSHRMILKAYVTFPNLVLKEYKTKELVRITQEEFKKGLVELYPNPPNELIQNRAIVFVIDMISTYKQFNKINSILTAILNKFSKEHYSIYYKYHPREIDSLYVFNNYIELDRKTAIESYYAHTSAAEVIVVGINSTGLKTAKNLGYRTISLAVLCDEINEEALKFFRKIGIEIPNTINDI